MAVVVAVAELNIIALVVKAIRTLEVKIIKRAMAVTVVTLTMAVVVEDMISFMVDSHISVSQSVSQLPHISVSESVSLNNQYGRTSFPIFVNR